MRRSYNLHGPTAWTDAVIVRGANFVPSVQTGRRFSALEPIRVNMRRTLPALIAALFIAPFIATPLYAQEDTNQEPITWPMALWAAAGAADITSSVLADRAARRLDHGQYFAREGNPLVGWLQPRIGQGPMLVIGAAAEIGTAWVACRLLRRKHPKVMRYILAGAVGAHETATAFNVRAANRWNRRTADGGPS
jgi:hypothetical protein